MPPKRIKNSPKKRGFHKPQNQSFALIEKDILAYLYNLQGPATITSLVKAVAFNRSSKDLITACLSSMVKDNLLVKTGKNGYRLRKNSLFFEGILDKNPRGFGFATKLSSKLSPTRFKKDPFISISRIGSANHGDTILIRILRIGNNGHPEAEILKILERGSDRLAGFFVSDGSIPHVIPEDPRFPFTIQLPPEQHTKAQDGDVVLVKLFFPGERTTSVQGTITEVLGSPDTIDVQMRLVIERFKLPHSFDENVLNESRALSGDLSDLSQRTDLRDIAHVTIDGETAKDFDDAIAVIKTKKGFRLYVSIADVSHFVKPGSALDQEAYRRGTSIYFPGRVIPMLPENLSNNLCSLLPDQDRLTVTAILDFDRTGKRTDKSFCRSIIRSRKRFSYTIVRKILIDRDAAVRREHKEFLTPLKWAGELARQLLKRRISRGSIGFNIPEAEISLDQNGKVASIGRAERNFAHQIIEECMLAANEAVAETFTHQAKPVLYRIHEKPDAEKIDAFKEFSKTLGLELPPADVSPEWFGHILELVKDSPKEYIVNNLLLRTMQQARYAPDNVGHFGLAATDYTHFTSPIRRYPDLLVHRALVSLLTRPIGKKRPDSEELSKLKDIGDFLSSRERTAIDAEREINDRLKVRFMEKHIGKTFDAVISGVSNFAFFVELLDMFVGGAVLVSQLTDDYYLFDIKHHRLIGEITAKTYQIGRQLKVTVYNVDKSRNRVNFLPA